MHAVWARLRGRAYASDLDRRLSLVADGDLDQLEDPRLGRLDGPIGRLCGIARQLRATVIDVQIGAQDLAGAGEGILNAISMQTSGAAEQSAAIAQTSATVEEVKASAQQAAQLAESVASRPRRRTGLLRRASARLTMPMVGCRRFATRSS